MSIQDQVNSSMEAATLNGYEFHQWRFSEVAEDLVLCDSDLEDVPTEELVPMIKEWYKNSDVTYEIWE